MTKLWVLSDLHLETIPYPDAFQPKRPTFDVLVAAGDIWQGDCLRAFRFLRKLADDKPIVFVMGNHEHWNGVLHEDLEMAKVLAREYRITLLDGDAVTITGCVFIGSTLWADHALSRAGANPAAETGEQIEIDHGGGTHLITVGEAVELHRAARSKLERLVGMADRSLPLVLVTHHAPHPDCLTEAMRNTWSAGNSASDLSQIIETGHIDLWVHGHLHHKVDMVRGNGTRILCNPAAPGFGNMAFDEAMVVEVGARQ
ncbi:metallophosphoesterase [Pararhizobium sp. BT-229]|uniref:metallophosphoesterase n=1 Tax=Pararhizobium sp. BT-229 TaxID=2986923 RepID=UPI0021F7A47F|nr:metallophosphoesterase [Pararhizobium sp. BT-229]MCV9964245.1 metallophosphoesterase [Pararhizobium sp. BT-229]